MGFGRCELTTRLTYSNFSTHKHTWRSFTLLRTQTFAQHVCQQQHCTHVFKQQSKTYGTHSMCLLLHCILTNQTSCVVSHISIAHLLLQPSKPSTQRKHLHSQHSELFCEPTARQIRVLDENSGFEPTLSNDTLTLELPLEVRSAYLIARIRTVLKQYEARAKAAKAISRARYPVVTKPVLTSLHQHLTVYDAYRANPKLKLYELYDLIHAEAGLYVSERVDGETVDDLRKLDLPYNDVLRTVLQRKANLVRRHIRIAEQYIDGVAQGKFPLRRQR